MTVRIVVAWTVLFSVAACSRKPVRFDGPVDVVYAVAENAAAIHTLAGMANFRVTTPEENLRMGGTVVFERPEHLRVEILSITGQAMATLVMDSTRVTVHDHRDGVWYRGDRSQGRLSGLPVEVGALLETLRDGGMSAAPGVLATAHPGPDGTIVLVDGPRTITLGLDEDGTHVRSRIVRIGGLVIEEATYDDVRKRDGLLHADHIQVSWPLEQRAVDVRFRKKVLNQPVDAEAFRITPPDGAVVLPLGEESSDG